MPSLWLVQPVHGRARLARICMEQRARMIQELAGLGIEAHQVVVGNDENLDTAREFDFHALERPNEGLGRKVNDGIEYACREGGADFVSYIGSDDWALASWMANLAPPDQLRTSHWAAFVAPAGDRLIVHKFPGAPGNAPWIIPRALLERRGFRPAVDKRMSGIDGSIRRGLVLPPDPVPPGLTPRERRPIRRLPAKRQFSHVPGDELRMVDFKGSTEQITPWSLVMPRQRHRLAYDESDVWGTLATRYPVDLVERMQALYANGLP